MWGSKPYLQQTMFQLKFASKQLVKASKKAEKEQKVQQGKVRKALQDKDRDRAMIYAENAIRKKNESLNYLRYSARVDAVHSRVQSAQMMKQVTKSMGSVTKDLEKALGSMDLEKVQQIMDKFEQQTEHLDVHTQVMDDTMGGATTLSTPQAQVDALILQVAEENGLEVMDQLTDLQPGQGTLDTQTEQPSTSKDQDLERKLAALRN